MTELGGAALDGDGGAAVDTATADEESAAPWAMADALKLSKELADPVGPQLTANTIP